MKNRFMIYGILLVIAFGYIGLSNVITDKIETKRTKLLVYNDVASDSEVKNIINQNSRLSKKIDFCDKSDNAEKKKKKSSKKINKDLEISSSSYTPLVVCMKNSKQLIKYQEKGLLAATSEITNSPNDEITINFEKIINAVIDKKNWSEFGGEKTDIRIFIPDKDTLEYDIFKKFLITTINGGIFPSDEEKFEEVKKKAEKFLNSSNCIQKENIYHELSKINSINSNDIYILFEADLMNSSIWSQKKLDIAIAYPKVTLVKHLYIQENSEENLNSAIEELTKKLNYRDSDTMLADTKEKIYNISDNFSFIEVEENVGEGEDDIASIVLAISLIVFMIVFLIVYIKYL